MTVFADVYVNVNGNSEIFCPAFRNSTREHVLINHLKLNPCFEHKYETKQTFRLMTLQLGMCA